MVESLREYGPPGQVWGTGVRMEILMRVVGLARVADTKVGNALVRGVSGGERKRVTSAEMLVGPKVRAPAAAFPPIPTSDSSCTPGSLTSCQAEVMSTQEA